MHHAKRPCSSLPAFTLPCIRVQALMLPCGHTALAERERANVQFNFLKETNSMFGFFTSLCDAYSRALMPPKDLMPHLRSDATDMCVVPTQWCH